MDKLKGNYREMRRAMSAERERETGKSGKKRARRERNFSVRITAEP